MIGWLVGGAWALCSLVSFRFVLRFFTADASEIEPSWFVFLLFTGAYFAALGGPFIVTWRAFTHLTHDVDFADLARILAGESRADKIARLQREAEQRERRIRDLERELDLV